MHIVYTRHGGGVTVCTPSLTAMRYMTCGGGRWGTPPRGFFETQIERHVADGIRERDAHRFLMAMHEGGCSTAEALEIIRDRDCWRHGTGHEIWSTTDIPQDRWFRNAWHRSRNGGPIGIDIAKARAIQFRRIKAAADAEAKRRAAEIDLFDHMIDLPWGAIRDKIRSASDETELRRVWPEQLG